MRRRKERWIWGDEEREERRIYSMRKEEEKEKEKEKREVDLRR